MEMKDEDILTDFEKLTEETSKEQNGRLVPKAAKKQLPNTIFAKILAYMKKKQ